MLHCAGQTKDQLVATDTLVLGDLLGHFVGGAAQHVATLDECVEEGLGVAAGDFANHNAWAWPHDGVHRLRHRVVVHIHHGHEVAREAIECQLASALAVVEADNRVGHHHVVVHVLTEWLGAVGDGVLVRLNAAAQVEDGFEVERNGADAEFASASEGWRVATGHPDWGMTLAVWLGQNVVRGWHGEVLALEGVVELLPHPWNFVDSFFPLALGAARIHDVERGNFVAAGAATRAPLVAIVGDVVEHGDAFGVTNWVVHARRQVVDT